MNSSLLILRRLQPPTPKPLHHEHLSSCADSATCSRRRSASALAVVCPFSPASKICHPERSRRTCIGPRRCPCSPQPTHRICHPERSVAEGPALALAVALALLNPPTKSVILSAAQRSRRTCIGPCLPTPLQTPFTCVRRATCTAETCTFAVGVTWRELR